ncbi:MAG: DUF2807 domain-containing protein [Marinifilaceae bacterium]|nr:DUF2807 domain-containing protein [Marinifilaceae bacterium]
MKIVYRITMHLALFLLLSFIAQFAAGGKQQTKRVIKGNGYTLTQSRNSEPFTKVEVSGNITLFIAQGEPLPIKITADDNLFPYIITDVKDGTLYIHFDDSVELTHAKGTSVQIAIPTVEYIGADMGAKVVSANELNAKILKINALNNAEIKIKGEVDTLYRHSGSGGILNYKKIVAQHSEDY